MANDSSTGGYLAPAGSPAPLEGQALLRFLQGVVVGITGLPGKRVVQRWQDEPPVIPPGDVPWAAVGVVSREMDDNASIIHDPNANAATGQDNLQRHEILNVLASFYAVGVDGEADANAMVLRDGLLISQNREALYLANMGLASVGNPQPVPSLLKSKWLYRVDLPFGIRRQVDRSYAIRNLVSASGNITTGVIHDTFSS